MFRSNFARSPCRRSPDKDEIQLTVHVATCKATRSLGLCAASVVPSPSCPSSLSPQVYTSPPSVHATQWRLPVPNKSRHVIYEKLEKTCPTLGKGPRSIRAASFLETGLISWFNQYSIIYPINIHFYLLLWRRSSCPACR